MVKIDRFIGLGVLKWGIETVYGSFNNSKY